MNSSEGKAAQEFGRRLYEAIFQDEVRDCLRRSLDVATQQPSQGLRIRLRLTAAQGLSDLPWEYLYDVPFKRFFVHSQTTPIIRYLDLPQGTQPLTVQLPLNVLVMIANPRDYVQLDVEVEWQKVQEALADLVQRELVTVTRLEKATLGTLQRQLRRTSYHIFHFIGHAGFDQQTQEGVLLLEDDNSLLRMVAGSYLGTLLHDHPTLQLALLNACEGARTAPIDPFAGVAQTLVQQGLPAVIAMQFEITDQAAITLAHEFYTALADGYPVDAALTEARKAIYAQGNDVEWGTPVLYMRSPNGQIFDVTTSGKEQPVFTERPLETRVARKTTESGQPEHASTPGAPLALSEPPSEFKREDTILDSLPAPHVAAAVEPLSTESVASDTPKQPATIVPEPRKPETTKLETGGQSPIASTPNTPPYLATLASEQKPAKIEAESTTQPAPPEAVVTSNPTEVKQNQRITESTQDAQPPIAPGSVPLISLRTTKSFLLQWWLANAVSWGLGLVVGVGVGGALGVGGSLALGLVGGLSGALVGAAQWVILGRSSPPYRWILASTVGWALGLALVGGVGEGMRMGGDWGLVGATAGTIYAVVTMFPLRELLQRATPTQTIN